MRKPVLNGCTVEDCVYYMDFIESNLVIMLQIQINNNICCVFNNAGVLDPILVENKHVCFPKGVYDDFNVVDFDPWNNPKLMQVLVQRATGIYAYEHPDIDIASICNTPNRSNGKIKSYINDTSGRTIIETPEYVNECISWLDLIIRLVDEEPDDMQLRQLNCLDQYINYTRDMEAYNRERGIYPNVEQQSTAGF